MELSFYEARNLGHNYVGTEHLLLALIREGEGVAARIMKDAGVDLEKVRALVMKILQEEGTETHQGGSPSGKSDTPNLDQFGTDLTEMAREGKLDPVIGREKEIERVVQILSRRTKNNPVLIGEPGVGRPPWPRAWPKDCRGNIPEPGQG